MRGLCQRYGHEKLMLLSTTDAANSLQKIIFGPKPKTFSILVTLYLKHTQNTRIVPLQFLHEAD